MFIPVTSRFLHWFTVGLIVPVLNLLLLSKGLDLAGMGLATAIYSTIIVVLELPSGIFADLVGRKRTYLVSLLFAGLGYGAMILATNPFLVVGAYALNAVARAFSSGSLEALFIDRYIAERGDAKLHSLTSAFNIAEALGLAVGALVGGLIPPLWARLAPAAGRYDGNLLAQLVIVMGHALLVTFVVPGDAGFLHGKSEAEKCETPRFRDFLRDSLSFLAANRIVKYLLFGTIFWGLTFSSIELLWQPHLKALLGSEDKSWIFGLLSSGYFMAAVLGSAFVPILLAREKMPLPRLLALFRLLNGLFIVLLAFQGSALGFGVVYLVMFSFNGMANPPEATLFNREIPSERRASLLSLASLFMQLGGIVGALGFGFLASRSSISLTWAVAGAIFAASAGIYVIVERRMRVAEPRGSEA